MHHEKFTFFSKTARLVALVQISSAAVKCVSSQVKYIIETAGDSLLGENINCRLMEWVNKYVYIAVLYP